MKKPLQKQGFLSELGATRTRDPRIKSPLLYRLSYELAHFAKPREYTQLKVFASVMNYQAGVRGATPPALTLLSNPRRA